MAEKKEKPTKQKIQIQTRKPEKRGIFANLGSGRDKNEHPLREILNFPAPPPEDNQETDYRISNTSESGYPNEEILDIQNRTIGYPNPQQPDIQDNNFGYPTPNTLDSQKSEIGYPNKKTPDNQLNISGYPGNNSLDIQTKNLGYPTGEIADSKISKDKSGISGDDQNLDSKISGKKISDSQKSKEKRNWQKYEKKRKSKGVFLRTGDEITRKFKQFCIAHDWDFSQGTELAWNKLMNDLDIQSGADLDSLIAQDDRRLKMLYKTRPFIINLYLRYNSVFNELSGANGKTWPVRWSPRDDEAAARYNDLPPAIVELGILQTQIQKGFGSGRIQTFKYYTEEIEKVLASGVSDEMLSTILSYHRQIWTNQTGREIDLSFLDGEEK